FSRFLPNSPILSGANCGSRSTLVSLSDGQRGSLISQTAAKRISVSLAVTLETGLRTPLRFDAPSSERIYYLGFAKYANVLVGGRLCQQCPPRSSPYLFAKA